MQPDFFIGTLIQLLLFISSLAPIWVPIMLIIVAWHMWVKYLRVSYLASLEWSMLEIRIPRDVFKSPEAMEIALVNAFHQGGGMGNWYQKYWQGRVHMWFSLEIVSLEGKVYFFIRTPKTFRSLVESQIYAQYPQAEISEVSDYTGRVPHSKIGEWSMFGSEFKLTKPDPYPIKTYVDYGLDKASSSLDPEQQIDPITQMLEFMGSIGKGEQIWFQILIKVHTSRYHKPGTWFETRDWKDLAKEEIQKVIKSGLMVTDDAAARTTLNLTKGQQEVIAAIERNVNKQGFDCGMRVIYLAEKDRFNPINITGVLSMVKQYNSPSLNGFAPANATGFDYPWQDPKGRRTQALKLEMYNAYRERSFFYPPHHSKKVANKKVHRKPFVLSSEELATVFHFPGRVAETPSFKRIDSKKVEPPVNLPM